LPKPLPRPQGPVVIPGKATPPPPRQGSDEPQPTAQVWLSKFVQVEELEDEIISIAGCDLGLVPGSDRPHVLDLTAGSEVAAQGVQVDDVLLSVDSRDMRGLPRPAVLQALRAARCLQFGRRSSGTGGLATHAKSAPASRPSRATPSAYPQESDERRADDGWAGRSGNRGDHGSRSGEHPQQPPQPAQQQQQWDGRGHGQWGNDAEDNSHGRGQWGRRDGGKWDSYQRDNHYGDEAQEDQQAEDPNQWDDGASWGDRGPGHPKANGLAPTLAKSSGALLEPTVGPSAKATLPKARAKASPSTSDGPGLAPAQASPSRSKLPLPAPTVAKSKAEAKAAGLLMPSRPAPKSGGLPIANPKSGDFRPAVPKSHSPAPTVPKGAAPTVPKSSVFSSGARGAAPTRRKMDPADSQEYTLDGLREKYAGTYTPEDIQAYWDTEMWEPDPAQPQESGAAEEMDVVMDGQDEAWPGAGDMEEVDGPPGGPPLPVVPGRRPTPTAAPKAKGKAAPSTLPGSAGLVRPARSTHW